MGKDDGGAATFVSRSLVNALSFIMRLDGKNKGSHSFALLTCYRQSKDDCGISVIISGQPLQARPAKTDGRGFKASTFPVPL